LQIGFVFSDCENTGGKMEKFVVRLVIVIVALTVLMLAGNIQMNTGNSTGFVALEQKCMQKCIQEQSFTQDNNATTENFEAWLAEK
jgi:hypothetical protein